MKIRDKMSIPINMTFTPHIPPKKKKNTKILTDFPLPRRFKSWKLNLYTLYYRLSINITNPG